MPTAFVDFQGNFKPLLAQSRVAGTAAGGNVTAGFATAFKKFAAPAAVAGLAVGAFKLGETFKTSYNTIRVETGATGKVLQGLEKDFKVVAASRPTGFNLAAEAVAGLNTRLGLTGKPLQEMSTQILRLSGLTKTDLGTNIESVTRVFGDWGIATGDQTGKLDALFRASQATGPSVDRISQLMVKYGAPLRQLGFDFDQTAALIGKFEKEGVNTQLVMGSMRIALGKMSKAGEPVKETLARVTDQIKNAGTAGEANAIALELFGARAGPDMAAAIREGRFDLGALFDTVANGSETIEQAATDTSTLSGKLGVLKNKVLIGMEPIATGVYNAINTGMAGIVPIAGTAASALGEVFSVLVSGDFTGAGPFSEDSPFIDGLFRVRELVQGVASAVTDRLEPVWKRVTGFLSGNATTAWWALGAAIGVVVGPLVLGALWGGLSLIGGALVTVAAALATPIGLIALLAAGFVVAYREIEPFRETVNGIATAIWDRLVGAFNWIKDTGVPAVLGAWGELKAGFGTGEGDGIFGAIGSTARRVLDDLVVRFTDLRDDVLDVYNRIRDINWSDAWDNLTSGASDLWSQFGNIDGLRTAIVDADWADIRTAITDGLTRVGETALADWVERMWDRAWDNVANLGIGDGVWSSIVEKIRPIGDALPGILEGARDLFRPMADAFKDLGHSVMELVNPIRDHLMVVWRGIQPLILPVLKGIGIALGAVAFVMHKVFIFQIRALATVIGWVASTILPAFTWALEHVVIPVIHAVAGFIQNVAIPYWGMLAGAAVSAFTWIADKVTWWWNTVTLPIFNLVWGYITTILLPTWQRIFDVVSVVFTGVWQAIQAAWGLIQPVFGFIVAFIRDQLEWRFNVLAMVVGTVWSGIQTGISDAWGLIEPILQGVVDFVRDPLIKVWDEIAGAVGAAFDRIPGIIQGALRIAGNVVAGFLRGAGDIAGLLQLEGIKGTLHGAANKADLWGEATSSPGAQYSAGGVRRMARGGHIEPGWGTPGKDSVPIMAMPGEVVIRKTSVDKYGLRNLLELNEGKIPGFAAGGEVLLRGARFLQGKGARISEHPAFGGVGGGHARGGYHYSNQSGTGGDAFDANFGPGGQNATEMAFFDRWAGALRDMGLRVLWRVAGHFNHLHADIGGGGGGGIGGAISGVVDSVTRGLRDIAGGALDRLPKAEVGSGLMGLVGGGANYLRQGVIDFIKGQAGELQAGSYLSGSGPARSIVQQLAAARGWTGAQWSALDRLIQKESSWNPAAANPTSSARGLFQKMTSIHGPLEPTIAGQANWGFGYIGGRYGNPVNALAFHDRNNWYGHGGEVQGLTVHRRPADGISTLAPGWNAVKNLTGGPETVINKDMVSKGGLTVHGDFHVHDRAAYEAMQQQMNWAERAGTMG